MIRNSLLTFLILFLAYMVFVTSNKNLTASQHQNQDNIIKAQNYLYEPNQQQVIVGSSLSSRLIMDSLPGFYNLSFGGLSIFDGLRIIMESKRKLDVLYIETNFITKDETKDFITPLFQPINYYSRKYLLPLREDKQPLAILGNHVTNAISRLIIKNDKLVHLPTAMISRKKNVNKVLFEKTIAQYRVQYSKAYKDEILKRQLTKLKEYVDELSNEGVQIIFFEMPINHELTNLRQPSALRKSFSDFFPQDSYIFIKLPDHSYITSDGLHLQLEEALLYTNYFKNKAIEFNNIKND